jgi:hypothetical protein
MHPCTGSRTRAGTRPWVRYAAGLLGAVLLSACTGQQGRGAASHLTGQSRPTSRAGQHGAGVAAEPPGATAAQVTLVTGDQVRLGGADGYPTVSVRPGVMGRGRLSTNLALTFDVGGDIYAIPADALPYLGSVLDPRLFDVSYLQRAGYAGLRSLPVTVSWRHVAHTVVPGITAPVVGTQTAGSIGMASGSFGHLLAGSSPGPGGPLSQIRRISLAPPHASGQTATAPAAEQPGPVGQPAGARPVPAVALNPGAHAPGARLYTLTVGVRDHAGRSANGIVVIQNLDNTRRFYSISDVTPGQEAAVSVPAGTYAVEAISLDYDSLGLVSNVSFVPDDQVSVNTDTTVTLSAHAAVPVSVSVPAKGAAPLLAVTNFTRWSAHGGGISGGIEAYGPGAASQVPPVHMYVMPTPRPRSGSLGYANSYVLVPRGTGTEEPEPDVKYNYYLDFASHDGISADQRHVVTTQDVATVRNGFAGPGSGDGTTTFTTPFETWGQFATQLYSSWYAFPTPVIRTDYIGGSPGTIWQQMAELIEPPLDDMVPVASPTGPFETFTPGEKTSVTWGASPTVPVPEWQDMGVPDPIVGGGALGFTGAQYYLCPVCREGELLSFNAQLADSDPVHTDLAAGFGDGVLATTNAEPTNELKFYRNGVLAQVSGSSAQVFPLLPGKARYEIDWASTASPVWNGLGTRVDSKWTFSSAPARPVPMPSYEYCSPDATQQCSFVPLVFAGYDFGDGLAGQVPAGGTKTFTVSAFHEAGDDGPPITRAAVQVSFDDGTTWAPVAVTALGGGVFRVKVSQPDTSGYVSVRVSLTDAAGDTLRQTIIRAYALTTSEER